MAGERPCVLVVRNLLLTLCAAAIPLQTGCSAFMNRVDDHRPVGRKPACDEGLVFPVLDMIPAALIGLISLGVAGNDGIGEAAGGLLVAGAYTTSAVVGFRGASRCAREKREWHKELRFGSLTQEIRSRTKMEPEQHPERPDTLILRAHDSRSCALLDWSVELDMMRPQLEARDVHRVECRFDEMSLWGGPLSELPESLEDTDCAPSLQAYFRSSDPREVEQRLKAMPAMCRQGAKVGDWYVEAATLASQGQCAQALAVGEKIWRTIPSVHEQLLRSPGIVACFAAQSSQEVSP